MESLIIEPTATAQWQRLLRDAQSQTGHALDETLESYLVFVLMRCMGQRHIAANAMALELAAAAEMVGAHRRDHLQNVGDQCLLISGLFPEQAARRAVTIGYYVRLGQTAYGQLAASLSQAAAELFHRVADGFVTLTDVLHAVRGMNPHARPVDLLTQVDMAQTTGHCVISGPVSQVVESPLITPEATNSYRRH
jgi:hypothetical protein